MRQQRTCIDTPLPLKLVYAVLCPLGSLDTTASQRLSSSLASSSSGSNETDLLTRNSVTGDSGRVTNVLMVTTSMRMVNRVHSNTTSTRPDLSSLGLESVVVGTSLQDGLLCSATGGNDTDHTTAEGVDGLLASRWELDAGGAIFEVVGHNDSGFTRSAGEGSSVSDLGLHVGDDCTLGQFTDGQNVSDGHLSVLSNVDELASVHSLACQEELIVLLVFDLVTELDTCNGSSTSRIMLNGTHNSLHVAMTLKVVQSAMLGLTNAVTVSGNELWCATLSL